MALNAYPTRMMPAVQMAMKMPSSLGRTAFRSMIMELMELRCDGKSTIFCTQYQKKDWHSRLRGGVHADAIMDRIVHNAVWIESGEVNMRAKLSKSED